MFKTTTTFRCLEDDKWSDKSTNFTMRSVKSRPFRFVFIRHNIFQVAFRWRTVNYVDYFILIRLIGIRFIADYTNDPCASQPKLITNVLNYKIIILYYFSFLYLHLFYIIFYTYYGILYKFSFLYFYLLFCWAIF